MHSVSCKEKALLEVSISLSNEGMQSHVVCKIDSGAETNILPMSIYQQLKHESHKLGKPKMKLTAYGGAELPNLGSCFVFVKVPDIQKLWKIQVQVVDVNGSMIIGNTSALNLGLLKLNWPIYVGNHDNSSNIHSSNTSATISNQPSSNHQPPVSTTMSHPTIIDRLTTT